MDISQWKSEIKADREQKDLFFREHSQSPLSPEARTAFEGLDCYPPDPNYRFETELHERETKEKIKVQDTQGNEREFLRWGEFKFRIGDTDCQLQAYKSSPEEDRLFVPLRDATSGKETYGAGRYLDLEADRHFTAEGKWIVDFNMAYNPWCAYSELYACPFVPPENWLKVELRAGERVYLQKQGKDNGQSDF